MGWQVCEVDAADEALLRRFWEVGHEADRAEDRPYDLFWPWESASVVMRAAESDMRRVLLGAFDGDELCGAATLRLPLHDNRHASYVEVHVLPARRRQGAGRALVEAAAERARELGRRVVGLEAYAPPGEKSPATRFGRAMGFAPALEDRVKLVDLVETEPSWERLAAEVAPHHASYELVTYHDTLPESLLAGYCRLNEAFNDEAPMGDLDVEPERWDGRRVRVREARMAESGRHLVGTVALAPDGSMAGVTEVIVNRHAPQQAWQSGTLVLHGHRGHRLGLAMKLANHAAVRARHPGVRVLVTGNAGVNAPMNAVNDRLGYREVERCVEMQRSL